MKYAYGSNKQDSRSTFVNRKFYDTDIVPLTRIEPEENASRDSFIDIFINKPFYGRIDHRSHTVFSGAKKTLDPNLSKMTFQYDETYYMKRFSNTDVYAMNFVVDAFNEMADYYNTSCQVMVQLSKEGPLGFLQPRVGWYSAKSFYDNFMEDTFRYYVDRFYRIEDKANIRNFKDFKMAFTNFLLHHNQAFSALFSTFVISRYVTPNISGLIVEIAIDDHSDDFIKTKNYLSSPNYAFLMECTKRYGFYLDRNVPWRLIANLSSATMVSYMKKYELKDLKDVFNKQFIKSYSQDLFLLRNAYINGYLYLISKYPNVEQTKEYPCEIISDIVPRTDTNTDVLINENPLESWLDIYLLLRASDIDLKLNSQEIKNYETHARQISKIYGVDEAVKFIDEKFNRYKRVLLDKNFLTTKFESVTNTDTLPSNITK